MFSYESDHGIQEDDDDVSSLISLPADAKNHPAEAGNRPPEAENHPACCEPLRQSHTIMMMSMDY